MAKGIKKIEWTGEGKIVSNLSTPNVKATIQADQFVFFKITEWADSTTEEDKKRNVLWHFQTHTPRESILKNTKKSDEIYGIQLPKKLCGPFTYYLQASLPSLDYSKTAGLAISGWCEPKIISSAWAKETKGEDVGQTHQFNFGNPIYLNLLTEGLNGCNNIIIEIYRRVQQGKGVDDDQLIKVYTKTPVINGEVNIILVDTQSWYMTIRDKKDIEEFYIKVKNPSTKEYVKDNNHDVYHARYLRINNKMEMIFPKTETGLSKLKTGVAKKYEKNAGTCKFTKISIAYKDNPDLIFDEGKFIRKANANDNFNILEKIHYDYDKWEIRSDAKPILDKVAVYLKEPPLLPVELGSHTDNRGTDEYNLELSTKRADAVVKYLVSKGVPANIITAKGYGKTKLIHKGDDISEELHQENRRTTLRFRLFENDAQPLVYDIVVPSSKNPAQLKINIDGFIRKGCHKTKEHKNEIISYDSYEELDSHPLKDGSNPINVELHSKVPTSPKIIDILSFGDNYKNIYSYYLHSCSYYSIVDHPTFIINAYPDINWVGHFRYDYKDAAFFKDIPVDLVTGIRFLTKLKAGIHEFIKDLTFLSGKTEEVADEAIESLTAIPDSISVGLHALYDFSNPATPGARKDYTEEYKAMAEVYIATVTIGVILVELLILYLTKGKGSFGRLRKYRKLARVSKKLNELGFELMTPKYSWSKGYYFEKQKDGRMAYISKERVQAYPLIGIQYHKVHKLADLAKDSEDKEGVTKLLDNYGINATLTLDFKGTINADYTFTHNSLTGEYSIFEKASNVLTNSKGIFEASTAIEVSAELVVDGQVETTITWIPFTVPQNIKLEVTGKAKLGGFVSFSRKYGVENREVYHQDTIKFTGLKGTYMLKAKVTKNDKERYDSNPTNKSVPITVFEGDEIKMKKVTAFNF